MTSEGKINPGKQLNLYTSSEKFKLKSDKGSDKRKQNKQQGNYLLSQQFMLTRKTRNSWHAVQEIIQSAANTMKLYEAVREKCRLGLNKFTNKLKTIFKRI